RSDARRLIQALEQERVRSFVPAGNIAYAYAGLGDPDPVFHWLELGLEDHSEILTGLRADAGWGLVQKDPRFSRVLERVGLRP
ncbi:MAG: hypothetical protein ABL977_12395, partial [Candidatus Eisenbacteria bacterium]